MARPKTRKGRPLSPTEIFDGVSDLVFGLSGGGSIVYANPAFRRRFRFDGDLGDTAAYFPNAPQFGVDRAVSLTDRDGRYYDGRSYRDESTPGESVRYVVLQDASQPSSTSPRPDAFSNPDKVEELIRTASHDLRSTFRVASLYVELAQSNPAAVGSELGQFLDRISKSAERGNRMVTDLAFYLRLLNKRTVPAERVDLTAVARGAVADLGARIDDAGADVTVTPLGEIEGDARAFSELFRRVLDNALRFRRPDVRLAVELSGEPLENGRLRLRVRDNGAGFDPRFSQDVFRPFRRLSGAKEDGTGLGLAICERVVSLHKGSIFVETQPGEGTTFTFDFPVRADASVLPAASSLHR